MTDTLRKQLFRAIEKSDIRMLHDVLKRGATLSYEPDDRFPVMHEAINCGRDDIEMLETLLTHGADINAKDRYGGDTPLHWLIGRNRTDLLQWFLKNHAQVNAINNRGETPLINLVRCGIFILEENDDVEAIVLNECRTLLDSFADIHALDKEQKSALHYAAVFRLPEVVKLLIQKGISVDSKGNDGRTALHMAVDKAHEQIVEILLHHGANADAQDNKLLTPLHILADKYPKDIAPAHCRIACMLIKSGAAVNVPDSWERTALCCTSDNGNDEIADILASNGADLDFNYGYTLRNAVFFEHDTFVEQMLKLGANPNLQDRDELNGSLHIVASEGYLFGAKILLQHGANIEICNIDGETPLCVAIRRYNNEVAHYLIQNGANVSHTDYYGNTPLFLAIRKENTELADILLKAGVFIRNA